MRRSPALFFGVVSLGVLCSSKSSLAQDAPAAAPVPAAAASPAAAAPSIRLDPRGITGVSPAWQAISKGDNAAVARDYEGALAIYRQAIAKEPSHAMLHYRVAQAELLKGDMKEAESAYQTALRFVGDDASLKARIIFGLAELGERQKTLDAAASRYTDYEAHVRVHPKAKAYPEAAAERKKRISEWNRVSKDSAEVKVRIERRLKEAEEATKKNAR